LAHAVTEEVSHFFGKEILLFVQEDASHLDRPAHAEQLGNFLLQRHTTEQISDPFLDW
jgi:hypothetical protein